MRITKRIAVAKPIDVVFAYLSDFTTTTEWDPGTVRTVRKSGDGGVGSEYLNTSTFLGRETRLTYVVEDLIPNQRIRLRGSNSTVVATDTMTFTRLPGGSQVTYSADFVFMGPTRIVAPLLSPAFTRLGNRAAEGMRAALDRL